MDKTVIYLIIFIAAIAAGMLRSFAGFGAGIILLLILPRFFDVVTATTLNQAICTGMPIIVAIRYRKYTEWKKTLLPGIAFIAAAMSTIRLLKNIDLSWLGAAMGLFLILLSVYYLFWAKKIEINPTPLVAVLFGLISGVLSGLFSIGVTLMAVYFLAITEDRNHYIADLQSMMAVSNLFSLATRVSTGFYTASLIVPTLIGFGGMLLGQYAGDRISGRMNEEKIKQFIYILVGITGIETLIKQLIKVVG